MTVVMIMMMIIDDDDDDDGDDDGGADAVYIAVVKNGLRNKKGAKY